MKVLFLETLFTGASIRGEPLAMMQLSSILKANGHKTELADISSIKGIKKAIAEFKPDILAYSVRTGFHQRKFEVNRTLKKENSRLFSIFGGSHATFFPSCIGEEGVDAVCVGEGDFALLELCDKLEKGEDITAIKNIWVKKGGRIYKNDVRPPIPDLDVLPLLDRQLVYQYRLRRDIPIKTAITLRGCPLSCSYCYSKPLRDLYKDKGAFVRRQSPQRAIEELENIRKYADFKYLIFEDDIFTLNKEWTINFLELYKEHFRVPFWAYTHVHHLGKEVISSLKEANCHMIGIGIESADYRIRKELLNRDMANSEIEEVCGLLKKAKIKISTGSILGVPGESIEKDIETLELNVRIRPDFAVASIIYPFPGTQISRIVRDKGYKMASFDDFTSMRFPKQVVKTEQAREEEKLQLLFQVVLKWPFLLKFVRVLVRLPLKWLYYCLAKAFKISTFKWILNLKLTPREAVTFIEIGFYYIFRCEV